VSEPTCVKPWNWILKPASHWTRDNIVILTNLALSRSRTVKLFILLRYEVSTAVRMMIFWVLAPCRLVGRCQRFGGTYCLHLQGWSCNAPLPSFANSTLKMEIVSFSEMLAPTDECARRKNPEEQYRCLSSFFLSLSFYPIPILFLSHIPS
jgi:hypothetical protein